MSGLKTVGLFAGIGGLEAGLADAGHEATHLVENESGAAAVLEDRFDATLLSDVRDLERLPDGTELVVAGFPCQDLSSVGSKNGISGARSSLIGEVLRLVARSPVDWIVLENVPFLLQLGRGAAITLITRELDALGFAWAYRVLDSQAFGVPQRRRRWYLVASRKHDPRDVLLGGDTAGELLTSPAEVAHGFYWTEGTRALGWAVDAVPPIKAGSSVGVPSPPAILLPDGTIVTPDIRDAERMQGFPADWTQPAENVVRSNRRWQLVGNSVTVPVARWLGQRFNRPVPYDSSEDLPIEGTRWPYAAWSTGEGIHGAHAGPWPVWEPRDRLADFLRFPTKPLSARAARGFLSRAEKSSLRFAPGFLDHVRAHIEAQERATTKAVA